MEESFIWIIIVIISSLCMSWGLCDVLFAFTSFYNEKNYIKVIKRGFIVFIVGLVLIILGNVILN
jgi:hypothetical protein